MSWLPLISNVPCNVPSRSVLLRLLECLCFVFCLVWFCFQVTGSWAGCLWTPSTFWPDSCRACNLFLPLHGFPVLTSFQEPTSEIFSILRIYISTHEIFSISTLLYQALTLALLSRWDTFKVCILAWIWIWLLIPVFWFYPNFTHCFPQVSANCYVMFPACCMMNL